MKIIINQNHIDKLKQQRRSIGLLQFDFSDDHNFSKWYSLTENLVIKAFGQKSNQVDQVQDIHNDMHHEGDFYPETRLSTKEIKDKFKNLITVLTEELELDIAEEPKVNYRKGKNISIKMNNIQTVNQTIDISVQIKNIIKNIKQTESDPKRANEAEQKLKELETQMKSTSPVWSTVKDILIWLLNFGRDVFIQALPIILEKYNK